MRKIFITNDMDLAKYAEESLIDRIMVDLEFLGKEQRQGHLNTVFSKHTFEDIKNIRSVIKKSDLIVRINPIHNNSEDEINNVIDLGADIIMLPMFKSKYEVEYFTKIINSRVKTCLLLETAEALCRIDDILSVEGIDEIHIGLNDLHLAMNLDFMFELLSDGIIEYLSSKIKSKNIKFGFGGISRIGKGMLDSSLILSEHYRLGSSMVILSRDFKNYKEDFKSIKKEIDLAKEIVKIDDYLLSLNSKSEKDLLKNKKNLKFNVNKIISTIKNQKASG